MDKYKIWGTRFEDLFCRVSEQAKYVDSRYGVKRRLRNLADDVQRKWPMVNAACWAQFPGIVCVFLAHCKSYALKYTDQSAHFNSRYL